jgi:hypothetical protein
MAPRIGAGDYRLAATRKRAASIFVRPAADLLIPHKILRQVIIMKMKDMSAVLPRNSYCKNSRNRPVVQRIISIRKATLAILQLEIKFSLLRITSRL